MKLLEQLVDDLGDEARPLSAALLKTKIILHRIGHRELSEWVDHELEGYGEAPLPEYRVTRGQVKGNISNMAFRYSAHPVPLMHLSDEHRDELLTVKFVQSVAVMENMVKQEEWLQRPIPLEMNALLGKTLTDGYYIERAWVSIPHTFLTQMLTQIRSRLLGFALQLAEQLRGVPDADVPAAAANAGDLFRNTVFGDNTTLIIGSNNVQHVNSHNTTGDIESLRKVLREAKVDEGHIQELETAIAADAITQPAPRNGKFGPSVSQWLGDQISRAASAAWNIEVQIAAQLLAGALQKYYG